MFSINWQYENGLTQIFCCSFIALASVQLGVLAEQFALQLGQVVYTKLIEELLM